MGNEAAVTINTTTLAGRYQGPDGISPDSIKNANNAYALVISSDAFGNPTVIEYTSDTISMIYKAVETMTYDGAGIFVSKTNSIAAR